MCGQREVGLDRFASEIRRGVASELEQRLAGIDRAVDGRGASGPQRTQELEILARLTGPQADDVEPVFRSAPQRSVGDVFRVSLDQTARANVVAIGASLQRSSQARTEVGNQYE